MADTKISDLANGTPALATDRFPIARAGANYYLTPADILSYGTSPVSGTKFTAALGTIMADAQLFGGTVTLNNAGVTFTVQKVNVTDSASAAASLLADWQVNAVSKFKVAKDGTITTASDLNATGSIQAAATQKILWAGRARLYSAADGIMEITDSADAGGVLKLSERTAPSAPAADKVYIYSQDNGAGKTQLMALFSSGAAQQIAIQP